MLALAALIGGVLVLWPAGPVGAQPGQRLASNTGQPNDQIAPRGYDNGQAFTTGSDPFGYTLTEVRIDLERWTNPSLTAPQYEVELWSADSSGHPLSKLATLTKPPDLTDGPNRFTSASGVDVAPNTTYVVVWDVIVEGNNYNMWRTNSDADDEGAGAGWSIADESLFRTFSSSGAWTSWPQSRQIEVHGYAKSLAAARPAARAPDPSNLARSDVQWDPVGGVHPVPTKLSEISLNKPKHASGSIDLSAAAASVASERQRHSRGFFVTTLVESPSDHLHLLRRLDFEPARGAPLLKVQIWHVYFQSDRGANTIEMLGDAFAGRTADLLAEPVEVCLPAPARDADRARLAVKGRLDQDWTILDTRPTDDGLLCADTLRVSWFTIVLEPLPEPVPQPVLAAAPKPPLYCFITHEHPSDVAFWGQVDAGASRFADELSGIDLRLEGSPQIAEQTRLIQRCVDDGAVALATSLPDPDGLRAPLLAALDAGVVVNSYNSGLESFATVGSLRHVAIDEAAIGRAAGQRFRDAGATGTLLCLLHEERNVGLAHRCDGLDEVYAGPVERLEVSESGVADLAATQAAIEERLRAPGGQARVEGVFSLNPLITEAVLGARRATGSDALIGSVDATVAVLRGIESGEVLFAIDSQAYIQGWLAMASLHSAVNLKNRATAAGFEGNVIQHISRFIGGTPVILGVVFTTQKNVAARIDLLTNTGRRGWDED